MTWSIPRSASKSASSWTISAGNPVCSTTRLTRNASSSPAPASAETTFRTAPRERTRRRDLRGRLCALPLAAARGGVEASDPGRRVRLGERPRRGPGRWRRGLGCRTHVRASLDQDMIEQVVAPAGDSGNNLLTLIRMGRSDGAGMRNRLHDGGVLRNAGGRTGEPKRAREPRVFHGQSRLQQRGHSGRGPAIADLPHDGSQQHGLAARLAPVSVAHSLEFLRVEVEPSRSRGLDQRNVPRLNARALEGSTDGQPHGERGTGRNLRPRRERRRRWGSCRDGRRTAV